MQFSILQQLSVIYKQHEAGFLIAPTHGETGWSNWVAASSCFSELQLQVLTHAATDRRFMKPIALCVGTCNWQLQLQLLNIKRV